MPNNNLLRKTLDYIEKHPERWDQRAWVNVCDTAYCFAGHALILHRGGVPQWVHDEDADGEDWPIDFIGDDGQPHSIQETARLALELSPDQAANMFHGDNTLDDLRDRVEEYTTDQVVIT